MLGDVALVGAQHPQCGTHPPRHPHTVTPTLAPTVETPLSQSDPGHTGPTFLTSYDGNAHFLSYTTNYLAAIWSLLRGQLAPTMQRMK